MKLVQMCAIYLVSGGPGITVAAAGAITALAAAGLSALRSAIADLDAQKASIGVVEIPGAGTGTSDNLM